ncbi:MAG: hypothetical protein L3J47_00610 [Sulfurovum sp.]|nr:hypothetical protein [Sulfurovum sp.]
MVTDADDLNEAFELARREVASTWGWLTNLGHRLRYRLVLLEVSQPSHYPEAYIEYEFTATEEE